MNDIITLIVVIITVVSAISRIKTRQKPKAGAKPVTGGELGNKLKAFFAEIQHRLEEQAPGGPSGAGRWDSLRYGGNAGEPSQPSYELSLEDLELEEGEPPAAPSKKPPAGPAGVQSGPAAAASDYSAPAPCESDPLAGRAAPCPEFMRRAVVWSEILGPPVALRDASWKRQL